MSINNLLYYCNIAQKYIKIVHFDVMVTKSLKHRNSKKGIQSE